jgi:GNAT superfamily N-acetyltransferase
MSLIVREFSGKALEPHLDGLGALRIAVLKDWPYLYEGSLDYERDYLKCYVECERSFVALVFDDEQIVGATTAMPMNEEGPEFQAAFVKVGYDLDSICYFGESILLPQYRGRGLGKEFFTRREAHAQRLGSRYTTFCAVDRAEVDARRPTDYRPLDGLWISQGYVKQPQLQAQFVWKEIGEETESPKSLTFWTKEWKR